VKYLIDCHAYFHSLAMTRYFSFLQNLSMTMLFLLMDCHADFTNSLAMTVYPPPNPLRKGGGNNVI
ncbi:hypothetical protein, partial [Helicobacter sp. T3_23-1059]